MIQHKKSGGAVHANAPRRRIALVVGVLAIQAEVPEKDRQIGQIHIPVAVQIA